MYTDLFLALLDSRNSREHPLLAALVYSFCPAAAHWWLSGADPVPPFDLVWRTLEIRATGVTLKQALEQLGLEGLTEHVKTYIDTIKAYRAKDTSAGVLAPELDSAFEGEKINFPERFGFEEALAKIGGGSNWRNLLELTRIWTFLYVDWMTRANLRPKPGEIEVNFKSVSLLFSAPGTRKPVYFPAWCWEEKYSLVTRYVVGLLVSNGVQDQLRFALTIKSAPDREDKRPWPSEPSIYALDRKTGKADPMNATIDTRDALNMLDPLSRIAKCGPYPPVNAINCPQTCFVCGFNAQCYTKQGALSGFAVRSLGIGV
jgi:hypothetical protein